MKESISDARSHLKVMWGEPIDKSLSNRDELFNMKDMSKMVQFEVIKANVYLELREGRRKV